MSFIGLNASAQDVIVKRNGDELQCKILEVSKNEVKYKRWSNQEGPTFTEKKADIFMLKYENGEKEMMTYEKKSNAVSQTIIEDSYIDDPDPISNVYLKYTTRRRRQTGLMKWGHMQTEEQGQKVLKTDWLDYKESRKKIRTGKVFILSSISGLWCCGATSPLTIVGVVKYIRGRRTITQIMEKYNNENEKSQKNIHRLTSDSDNDSITPKN